MKYPINIEAFISEIKIAHPENKLAEPIFRAILPMVNEAYSQGLKDGGMHSCP